MNEYLLLERLKEAEGFRSYAYQDHLLYWTIGYGTLIDKRKGGGITRDEATYLLLNRVRARQRDLDQRIPWWKDLDDVRQRVLLEMAFQMGTDGLLSFKFTLKAVRERRFEDASRLMLNSLWARSQTPERALVLSRMMRTGEDPSEA